MEPLGEKSASGTDGRLGDRLVVTAGICIRHACRLVISAYEIAHDAKRILIGML